MNNYILSPKAMVMTAGSSKGAQRKYFDEGYWYKEDRIGREGEAEELASKLLECSNLKNYAVYETCQVNGKSGCRSKNFLKEDESLISFERLHSLQTGISFVDAIRRYDSPEERIGYAVDFVKTCTGFDVSSYLGNILLFDAVILNQDRHFNNLAIIVNNKTGEVSECPIFDNGDSFLNNFSKFPPGVTMEENLLRCVAQPFCADAFLQANVLPTTLAFNYQKIEEYLAKVPETSMTKVLRHQLKEYRGMIPDVKEIQANRESVSHSDTYNWVKR